MADNIKRLLSAKGLNPRQLAIALDFKYTTVNDWVNAKTYPRIDKIEMLANFFNVSKSDLVENKNEEIATTSPVQAIYEQLTPPRQAKALTYLEKQLLEQNEEETKKNEVSEVIQLYSYNYYDHPASAGTGQYLNDVRVEQIELPIDVDADFVIPIKGDSMEPDYHDGDLVFIQTSVDLNDGVIGVFNYNGEAYIKQLVIDT